MQLVAMALKLHEQQSQAPPATRGGGPRKKAEKQGQAAPAAKVCVPKKEAKKRPVLAELQPGCARVRSPPPHEGCARTKPRAKHHREAPAQPDQPETAQEPAQPDRPEAIPEPAQPEEPEVAQEPAQPDQLEAAQPDQPVQPEQPEAVAPPRMPLGQLPLPHGPGATYYRLGPFDMGGDELAGEELEDPGELPQIHLTEPQYYRVPSWGPVEATGQFRLGGPGDQLDGSQMERWVMWPWCGEPAVAEGPFRCLQCGERFPMRGDLTVHLRVRHTTSAFQCRQCGLSYRRRDSLRNHQRAIHEGFTVACPVCNREFTRRNALRTHQKKHGH